MKWTNEKPAKVGWYWHKFAEHECPEIVRVFHNHGFCATDGKLSDKVDIWGGQWSSEPIQPPEDMPHTNPNKVVRVEE